MSDSRTCLPFGPRDPHEPHRSATPLELLFDLVTVVAIASAAAGLHHSVSAGHAGEGVIKFALAFFAVWWAWMNYTWYASAYDNDGPLFRLLTAVIMGGSLVIAAGIPAMFERLELTLVIIGYVVMRLGMIALWLRAAHADPAHRRTARAYAIGIGLAQLYWSLALGLWRPEGEAAFLALFALGVVIELAVPAFAERLATTPWHRHHIMERYGLLTIIVLGEILIACAMSLAAAADRFAITQPLVHVALAGLVITFSMWWLYFSREDHLSATDLPRALQWGYGHVLVFAAGAAVGAGFGVLVDVLTGHAEVSLRIGDIAVAAPLALYLFALFAVRDRYNLAGPGRYVLLLFAALILIAGMWLPAALELMALLSVLSVWARSRVPLAVA